MQANSTAASKPAFRPRVRRLGEGRYLVESASRRGRGHVTTATTCSCVGFSYRKSCRHIAIVQSLEPSMAAWYSQAVTPAACSTVEEEHTTGSSMLASLALDAHLAAAWSQLTVKRRALADAHPQCDDRASLLRQVDQAERTVAALEYSAMRGA